jgi:hypothetical protein
MMKNRYLFSLGILIVLFCVGACQKHPMTDNKKTDIPTENNNAGNVPSKLESSPSSLENSKSVQSIQTPVVGENVVDQADNNHKAMLEKSILELKEEAKRLLERKESIKEKMGSRIEFIKKLTVRADSLFRELKNKFETHRASGLLRHYDQDEDETVNSYEIDDIIRSNGNVRQKISELLKPLCYEAKRQLLMIKSELNAYQFMPENFNDTETLQYATKVRSQIYDLHRPIAEYITYSMYYSMGFGSTRVDYMLEDISDDRIGDYYDY